MWSRALVSLSLVPAALAHIAARADTITTLFSNVSIFTIPKANYSSYISPKVLYARTAVLNSVCSRENHPILATWENYSPEPPYFPIFQSDDLGKSWHEIARVQDQVNGWGLRYQPFLYELPQKIGNFPAGTVLLSGSSIPADLSQTQIELYASMDKGKTWKFISHVAHGGRAIPNNGETPVWEPFLMVYKDQLVLYYSDQRDPKYGQKLVHVTTKDLYNWSSVVNDVTAPQYSQRPGMTTVAQLPNGKYLMTYEYGGAPDVSFAVYYKIADSPLEFEKVNGTVIKASNDGSIPVGSPYVVWTEAGGPQGTLVVSSGGSTKLWLNKKLGDKSAWTAVDTKERTSYTRSLTVLPDRKDILIAGGGLLPPNNNTYVDAGVISVDQSFKAPANTCQKA